MPWFSKSVAVPIARASRQMTLFVPKGVEGFVSLEDGSISLKNILIPVASNPAAQPSIQAAVRMACRLNCTSGVFTVLHVGEREGMPEIRLPEVAGWRWDKVTRQGDVIDVICKTALETEAGLVVMSTDGRNGFLDALRGSHSERVLRECPCAHWPFLPVGSSRRFWKPNSKKVTRREPHRGESAPSSLHMVRNMAGVFAMRQ